MRTLGARAAFSKDIRLEIGKRAGWASEQSGKSFHDGHMVHAAHLNHDRLHPDYNSPSNGILLTVEEHLAQHVSARGRAREIGLTEPGNEYAIKMLEKTPKMRI